MSNKILAEQNYACKNCDTVFDGNYCPNCGQSTKDYDKPFGFIMYDLVGNIITFDTRLWRTFKSVLFYPGKMAHEFIIGHRVRYMPPFRFYVFVSFIFFFLLNISTQKSIKNNEDSWFKYNSGDSTINYADTIKQTNDSVIIIPKFNWDTESNTLIEHHDTLKIAPEDFGKIYNTDIDDVKENPEMYFQAALKYFSWSLFFLMPLYAFLLWLFFKRKYKNYIGHLIFAVNQHAFLFIILTIIIIANMIFQNSNVSFLGYLVLAVPIYSIIGARNLYKRSWLRVFFRLCSIFFIYFLTLSAVVVVIIMLTFDH